MVHKSPKNPLIAVIGATGTGKSQLAVALANQFDGEIINADALQLYKGLPIATNKISHDEMQSVPHHLLGRIPLEEEAWTAPKFVKEAGRVIEEIRSRGRTPILVGGTHYYTQALIFPGTNLLAEDGHDPAEEEERKWPILKESREAMLQALKQVDPEMAAKWHPNDRRKIRRSLAIWLQTERTASELYSEQRLRAEALRLGEQSTDDASEPPKPMQYDTLLFWIHADKPVLDARLASRVGKMTQEGLIDEVEYMRSQYRLLTAHGATVDETRGIWVAIGYKEFKPYLDYNNQVNGRIPSEAVKLCAEAIELMKIATRQYARRQTKWITNKLLPTLRKTGMEGRLFLLNGTDLEHRDENVQQQACTLTAKFLNGDEIPDPSSLSDTARTVLETKGQEEVLVSRTCEICGVTAGSERSWKAHLKSKRHKYGGTKRGKWRYVPDDEMESIGACKEGDVGDMESIADEGAERGIKDSKDNCC